MTQFDGRSPFSLDLIDKCAKGWSCMGFEYTRFSDREWAFVSPLTTARITTWLDRPAIHFPGWDLKHGNWKDGLFGAWVLETPFHERKEPNGMTIHYQGFLLTMNVHLLIPGSNVLRISTSARIRNTHLDLEYFHVQTNLSEIIRIAEQATEISKLQFPLLPDRLLYHWLKCVNEQFNRPKIQNWLRRKSSILSQRFDLHFPNVIVPLILSFLFGQQLFQTKKS